MRKISNNASTLTIDAIDAEAGAGIVTLTFAVSNANGELLFFPDVDSVPADYAHCTLENAAGETEIVKLKSINIALGTVTVDRGSAAFPAGSLDAPDPLTGMLAFPAGSRFECRATAGLFQGMIQRDGDTIHGGVFGDAPPAPPAHTTLITKHSTSILSGQRVPDLGDMMTGELLWNAKTRKLWGGGVDSADQPERVELVPGIHYGSTEPEAHFRTQRTLWFHTVTEDAVPVDVYALKIWTGTEWLVVTGTGVFMHTLLLGNNVALRGLHTDGLTQYDLAKVNAANELVIGDSSAAILRLIAPVTQVSPRLRIKATAAGNGYWDLISTSAGGSPRLQMVPVMGAGISAELEVNTISDASANSKFIFSRDGQFKLPVGVVPQDPEDAVPLAYLEAALGAQPTFGVGSLVAAGQFTSGGGAVGTQKGCSVAGGGGVYTITLTAPLTSANNASVFVTAVGTANTQVADIVWTATDTTHIVIRTFTAGSQTDPAARACSFFVVDRGG